MKIAFINSSLEPERDGVGDYTRLLAQECVRQGQECFIIALHDRHAQGVLHTDEGEGVTGLRLPSTLSWAERAAAARAALVDFGPDWVSVQFVPYGFHPKGLAWEVARILPALLKGYKTHVMLHELWLGTAQQSSTRHRVYGWVQKRILLSMLQQLKPYVVHTSNCAYVHILQHTGVSARRLPLFGAILVTSHTANDWLFPMLREKGISITTDNRDGFWLLGFFGSLPPDWPAEPLFGRVRQAAQEQGRQVVILSAGSTGAAGETLWRQMTTNYAPEFAFHALGRLAAPQVSEYLNTLDFGLAAAPAALLGKSSAVAAMLDHGLPVIVNRDDVRFGQQNLETTPGFWHVQDTEFKANLRSGPQPRTLRDGLAATTRQYVRDLHASCPHWERTP